MKHRITEAQLRKLVYSQVKRLAEAKAEQLSLPGMDQDPKATAGQQQIKNKEKELINSLKTAFSEIPGVGAKIALIFDQAEGKSGAELVQAISSDSQLRTAALNLGLGMLGFPVAGGESLPTATATKIQGLIKQLDVVEKKASA